MSLYNLIENNNYAADVDPGYISDSAMESLYLSIVSETLNPEEVEELVSESLNYEGVFEAQKNIVRLNKQAKFNRAYKTAILQCAAEDKRKEYKKLRTLWKLEAALFKKLERNYANKAKARARVAVKELAKKKKQGPIDKAVQRANKATDAKLMGGTNKLMNSGIVKPKRK